MIENVGRDSAFAQSLEPALFAAWEFLRSSSVKFHWDRDRAGVDFLTLSELPTGPNRARVKFFLPQPGTLVAFAYKDSQLPFSSDRFAYGALIVKNRSLEKAELEELCTYLARGFHPEKRPTGWKRAFPYTIPR